MNLGNIFQALTQGVKQPDTSAGTSGTLPVGERNYRALSEAGKMTPGQTIQGEVVGKEGNTVQIALDAETVLTARLERSIDIMMGQSMTFEVKSNSGSLLSLTPLYANMANEATILRALAAAGLSADADNMKMVSDMMQEGMPIDRDSIAYVNRQLVDFPDANPSSIIQMIRLGMPISEINIEQFEQYKNYEHQILQSAEQIMEELPQTYMELISEGKDSDAVLFYEQIIKALIGGDEAGDMGESAVVLNEGAAADGAEALAKDVLQASPETPEGLPEGIKGEGQIQDMLQGKDAEQALKAGDMDTANPTAQSTGLNEAALQPEAEGDRTQISQGAWRELGDMLAKLGAEPEQARQIADGNVPPKEVLAQINEFITANTHTFKEGFHESLKELFGSEPFNDLLKAEMTDKWLLKPEEVAYKENVEQLYERIKEQTEKISEAFQMVNKGDSQGAKTVQNLQNNVDFINQMNHMFTYIQLPLKMTGNQAHGDLYVYTNKKSLAKNDGNVSALLHLDMENLGPLDVYVTMNKSQNKVNTNFTLKDEAAMDLIAENIHILDERLAKRGYKMKADFKLKNDETEEDTNIMEEILKQNKNISVLSRTSFDMRA